MIHKSEWLNIATAAMVGIMSITVALQPQPMLDTQRVASIIDAYVPMPVPRPVHYSEEAITCMTDNVYHEARGEPGIGQRAVVDVTLSRMYDKKNRWPKTVCEVVYQPFAFSWTSESTEVNDPMLWLTLRLRVKLWMENYGKGIVDANHYHTVDISPKWDNNMQEVAVIGAHAFYED